MIPLDEDEEEEVSAYIFDKIKNDGKPFSYSYFDPAEKKKKTIRIKIIDSRTAGQGVVQSDRALYAKAPAAL